jgi:ABC transporter substrate binding protein
VGRGPQHPDRHSLGDGRPDINSALRARTRRAAARPHCFASYTLDCGAAAANAQDPHRFPAGRRSGRQRLRREPATTGRQRHRFHQSRGLDGGKWLELLKEIAPRVNRVAFLFNPATATYAKFFLSPFKSAAASVAVEAIEAPVHDSSELDSAIAAQAREPNSGLIVMPDAFTADHRVEITSLAARYRLPAVYPFRFFTELGGLLSYGNDPLDVYRKAAAYADRILRGAKPSELPVQAPVKFELVINLKTAKALGLEVPARLLARADEVIE